MRLLLDTHVALWAITDDPKLPAPARALIVGARNRVFVSTASIWEVAIKRALARADMPVSGSEALGYFRRSGFEMLAISPEHAAYVEGLPPLHSDPFDRLLVAQALVEPMRLLSHDRKVIAYSDTIIAV